MKIDIWQGDDGFYNVECKAVGIRVRHKKLDAAKLYFFGEIRIVAYNALAPWPEDFAKKMKMINGSV